MRGRQGRVGSGARRDAMRGRVNGGGVPRFGDVDRHGTDVVAPGCSDSGGWRMPRGRGLWTGEGKGMRDAERRGWQVVPGDVGPQWQRAEGRASGAAWRGALTGRPGSTVPPGSVLNRFKLNQKYFKRIQNSSKFDWSKRCFSKLQKLEIKYGWKEF
jgi:hypothetical protein